MSKELTFELAGGPYAVTAARLALSEIDEMVDETQAFDVRLLVSELVTNSVKHANAGPDESISLNLTIDESVIRCDVRDPGPRFDPPDEPRAEAGGSDYGLSFATQIADGWLQHHAAPSVWL